MQRRRQFVDSFQEKKGEKNKQTIFRSHQHKTPNALLGRCRKLRCFFLICTGKVPIGLDLEHFARFLKQNHKTLIQKKKKKQFSIFFFADLDFFFRFDGAQQLRRVLACSSFQQFRHHNSIFFCHFVQTTMRHVAARNIVSNSEQNELLIERIKKNI
jgi:hypothetical protein